MLTRNSTNPIGIDDPQRAVGNSKTLCKSCVYFSEDEDCEALEKKVVSSGGYFIVQQCAGFVRETRTSSEIALSAPVPAILAR
jgi:hypothetical protein